MKKSPGFAVEVSHLENGNSLDVTTLSLARERRGGWMATRLVVLGSAAAMCLSAGVAGVVGKAVYAPPFLGLWLLVTAGLVGFSVHRVRRRLGRYVIGPRLDNEAFAPMASELSLVARHGALFSLTVAPGMHGHIDNGRAPLPIEALVVDRPVTLEFGPSASAEVAFGTSRFLIRSVVDSVVHTGPALPTSWTRPFGKVAVLVFQFGIVASLYCLVPRGTPIGNQANRISPKVSTPWEAEKWLRIEAQLQAPSLHQCFDPLPASCQHPGYVGVGVSLSREGEIRSHWISRSTFGAECPVDKCMSDVVSTWAFDPIPQAMRVILPVQVIRTEKPLPQPLHVAERDEVSSLSWGGTSRGR